MALIPESPMVEPLDDIKIISQRHSVILDKSNVTSQLEIKNAQLEWLQQKLTNELSTMSLELKVTIYCQACIYGNLIIRMRKILNRLWKPETWKFQTN